MTAMRNIAAARGSHRASGASAPDRPRRAHGLGEVLRTSKLRPTTEPAGDIFDLEVRIGNLVRKVTLEGETDVDGNAYCAVEISPADLAAHWYPDAPITVTSGRRSDDIEPIAFERGTHALSGPRRKDEGIPVIFEITRHVH